MQYDWDVLSVYLLMQPVSAGHLLPDIADALPALSCTLYLWQCSCPADSTTKMDSTNVTQSLGLQQASYDPSVQPHQVNSA